MTKEELLDLLYDDEVQDAIYNIAANVGYEIFGRVTESYWIKNSKTNTSKKAYRTVMPAELLDRIASALENL